MLALPPLDLVMEVTTASGNRFKWDANQPAGSRPRDFSFRTKIGEGYSDADLSLARRIDLDYPDLELLNSVIVAGANGDIAYEGRIQAMPRDLGDSHSIGVTLAGWMAHARDRKFTSIFVDRDLGQWHGISRARKAALLLANFTPYDAESSSDPTDNTATVATTWTGGWSSPFRPIAEAWYDAGATNLIGSIGYSWARTNTANMSAADTNWTWLVALSSDDKATVFNDTGNLRAAGPSLLQTFTPVTARRFGLLQVQYAATPIAGEGVRWGIDWSKIAVYGDHGLPVRTGEGGEPGGVTASDVIKNVARRWCPAINTNGVQDTSYVIQHLAFRDPTDPYDAFLEVNKYHLWHLGVWENRTLTFRPYDLTDYDWEIRTDDEGTNFSPAGPSTESIFNGIVVRYTDLLTGDPAALSPDTTPALANTDFDNPWNKAQLQHWDDITLSTPTLAASALQIGRMVLEDRNRPKAPGSITVKGHVRDRQGNPQPVWKVRAGDTISVSNFPNDGPRLIHETNYNDEAKSVTISVEAPAATIDAVMDRQNVALTAKGLT